MSIPDSRRAPVGISFGVALLLFVASVHGAAAQSSAPILPAAVCAYTLAPTTAAVAVGGASGNVTVTTAVGCAWTSASNAPWVTITSDAGTRTGPGIVSYTADGNTVALARSGVLMIANKSFTTTQPACTYTLAAAASPMLGMNAGTGSVVLTAAGTCTWTNTSSAPWVTITSGTDRTGTGTVSYTVDGNTGPLARSATLTIGGKPYKVNQAGCTYTLDNPLGASFAPLGGDGNAAVTTGDACAWTVTSPVPWATFPSGVSRVGTGSVAYAVAPNTSGAARTTSLMVAGKPFKVSQATCTYALSAASGTSGVNGSDGSVNVTTSDGCPWTVTNPVTWVTLTSPNSQVGNGAVNYSVAPNPTLLARTATLTIANKPYKITQAPCSFTLDPATTTLPPAGGPGSFGVTTGDACTWTSTIPLAVTWVHITSDSPRTASGPVTYTVDPNTSPASRTATLTAGGKPFKITQAACTYILGAATTPFGMNGGDGQVSVTTQDGCPWSSTSPSTAPWLTITSPSPQTGNGAVSYTVAGNVGPTARSAALAIAGKTYMVPQLACTYALDAATAGFPPAGGPGNPGVTTGTSCKWTNKSPVQWATITSGDPRTGTGAVAYTVEPNTTTAPRMTTMTMAGKSHAITQANCTYAVTMPATSSVPRAGTSGNVPVTTQDGCPWPSSSNVLWLTISSPSPQTGSGAVNYTVAANVTGSSRTAILTVAGKKQTITQPGCTYTLGAPSAAFTVEGGDGSVAVTTDSDCAWTSTVPGTVTWVVINSAATRTGGGTVSFTVMPNATSATRTTALSIAGKTFTVTQSAAVATADLRVVLQPPPGSAFTGKVVPAPSTVKNLGSKPSGPFDLGVFVSPSNQAGAGMLLRSVHVGELGPGATMPLNLDSVLPNDLAPGDYFMSAVADTGHTVAQPPAGHAAVVGPFKVGRGVDKVKEASASVQLTTPPPLPGMATPFATCSIAGTTLTLSGGVAITNQVINGDDSVTATGTVTLTGSPSATFSGTFMATVDGLDRATVSFVFNTASVSGLSGTATGMATGGLKFASGAGPGGAGGGLGFSFQSDPNGFTGTFNGSGSTCAFAGSFTATVDQIFELVFLNFLNAGAFSTSALTPVVKFPVPFSSYEAVLSVVDTPNTLPSAGSVLFTGPSGSNLNGVPADSTFSTLDQPDGFAVYLSDFITSTTGPQDGDYTVRYKGIDRPFHVNIDASRRAVIPFPTVTLNPVRDLQKVTWQYRDRQTGATIVPPAFVGIFGVLISTVNSDGSLDFCSSAFFTDRNILSFTLGPTAFCPNTIHWDSVFSLDFIYVDSLTFNAYGVSFVGPRQAFPQLLVGKTGSGMITSSPGGISCGAGCSSDTGSYARGSTVTLTAAPSSSIFLGWTGDCAVFGSNPKCTLTMSFDRVVGAVFAPNLVRFLNNTCFTPNCGFYTATLTSSIYENHLWSSFTLAPSPYQPVFTGRLNGFTVFQGPPFNRSIAFTGGDFVFTAGKAYTIRFDVTTASSPLACRVPVFSQLCLVLTDSPTGFGAPQSQVPIGAIPLGVGPRTAPAGP